MIDHSPDTSLREESASWAKTFAAGLVVGLICLPLVIGGQVFRQHDSDFTFGSVFSLTSSLLFGSFWIVLFSRSREEKTSIGRRWSVGLLTGVFLALADLMLDVVVHRLTQGVGRGFADSFGHSLYLLAAACGLRGGLWSLRRVERKWTIESIRLLARTSAASAGVWVLSMLTFFVALGEGGERYAQSGRDYAMAAQSLIVLVFAGLCAYPRRETPFLYGLEELKALVQGDGFGLRTTASKARQEEKSKR